LPIFQLIQDKGGVPEAELYQVFNMGIGMVVISAAEQADPVLRWLHAQKQRAWRIGEVVRGRGEVRLV
jgi:phosphoribosylformylglycinamidine cyclo-ligase